MTQAQPPTEHAFVAKWAAIGFLAGASVIGLCWSIAGRAPNPAFAGTPPAAPTSAPAPFVRTLAAEPVRTNSPAASLQLAPDEQLASAPIANAQPDSASPASLAVPPEPAAAPASPSRLNLNRASAAELELLPGVGPTLAQRIVDHRSREPFRSIADLTKVKGIGQTTLDKLRPLVCVE